MLSVTTMSSSLNAPPTVALGAINNPDGAPKPGEMPDSAQVASFAKVLSKSAGNVAGCAGQPSKPSQTQNIGRSALPAHSPRDRGNATAPQTPIPPHTSSDSASQSSVLTNPAAGPTPTAPPPTDSTPTTKSPADSVAMASVVTIVNLLPALDLYAMTAIPGDADPPSGSALSNASAATDTSQANSDGVGASASIADVQAHAAAGQTTATSDADALMTCTIRTSSNDASAQSGVPQSNDAADVTPKAKQNDSALAAAPQPAQQGSEPSAADIAGQWKELGINSLQVTTNPAGNSAVPQNSNGAQVPVAASAATAASTVPVSSLLSAKASSDARQNIAQQIQPNVTSLLGMPAGTNVAGAPTAAGNDGSRNSAQSQINATGQGTAQPNAQGSAQMHSPSDGKGSGNGTAADHDTTTPFNTTAQASSAATVAASQSALVATTSTPANHASSQVSAQIAAQTNASSTSMDVKNAGAAVPTSQSAAIPASLPAGLPRSLDAVAQATQLYQRLGGTEMHIAMDMDSLGAIDLRAVVHQGSLSATIAVQRPEVQTFLVNELPALQHSLTEKNLQVNQISVLAGSIGGGTNMNNQPQQQHQNRSAGPAAPSAMFAERDREVVASRMAANESVVALGSSGRLSVLA